jgi:hypothetical protein
MVFSRLLPRQVCFWEAANVIFSFTGDVSAVDPFLASQFVTSNIMSGKITVSQTDTNGDPNIGNYAIQSFEAKIGAYDVKIGTSGQVEIVNGALPVLDIFRVQENGPFTIGNPVNFLTPSQFEIALRSTLDVFPDDTLPTVLPPPSISDFNNNQTWRLNFGPPGAGIVVAGAITSLTAVPLPPAVILFGAGLVALIGLGARNWQRASA